MQLLLFVLLGHVCLVSLSVADLVEVINNDLDNILFSLGTVKSNAYISL